MKITLLNGGRSSADGTDGVQAILLGELRAAEVEVETFVLRELKIDTCRGCYGCWTSTPGICRIDDAGRRIAGTVVGSDLTVFLTPITFGGYSSELKKVVDRLIPIISPLFLRKNGMTRHRPRYEKYPRLLGLGLLPAGGTEEGAVFQALVAHNGANLHAPTCAGVVLEQGLEERSQKEKIRAGLKKVGVGS